MNPAHAITEDLLIRACIAEPSAFEGAFREFEARGSLDDLNEGTIRLIPFLFRRLERERISAANFGILKGVYTRYWYLHHMHRSRGLGLTSEILSEIPFLVLKGQAFQSLLYGMDAPTRPGDDTDILIPTAQRHTAFKRFQAAGFHPRFPRTLTERLDLNPSTPLTRKGTDIDLHWQVYPPSGGVDVVDLFFGRSIVIPGPMGGLRTLCLEHHLAHTLIHGWGKNEVSPIRWVLDAAHLVRHPSLDWNDLVHDIVALGWQSVALRQLQRLHDEYQLPVPSGVLTELKESPTGRTQRAYLHHATMKKGLLKIVVSVFLIRPFYLRHAKASTSLPAVLVTLESLAISLSGLTYRLTHRIIRSARSMMKIVTRHDAD